MCRVRATRQAQRHADVTVGSGNTGPVEIHALLEHLDLRRSTPVGDSMGTGDVARYLGRYGSGRVSKAVLVSPIPHPHSWRTA
jgi:pimeloyl-ACP methyl ester carboxylesterase